MLFGLARCIGVLDMTDPTPTQTVTFYRTTIRIRDSVLSQSTHLNLRLGEATGTTLIGMSVPSGKMLITLVTFDLTLIALLLKDQLHQTSTTSSRSPSS